MGLIRQLGPVRVLPVLLLVAGACSAEPPRSQVVEIDCERFSATAGDQITITRRMTLEEGTSLVVRLCSNPSTGFQWTDAAVSSPSVLREQSHVYVPPDVVMPGAAGMEQWEFVAEGRGRCTVSMSYDQPWAGGESGARVFELELEVT